MVAHPGDRAQQHAGMPRILFGVTICTWPAGCDVVPAGLEGRPAGFRGDQGPWMHMRAQVVACMPRSCVVSPAWPASSAFPEAIR
eukprot:5590605-Heterocapsa_arctica.AAC.1